MRRRVGVASVQKQQLAQARFKDKGSELAEDQLKNLTQQMEAFRTNLQEFATKYKNDIRKDPEFRRQFQEMCATVGVDPLASSRGFWAKLLGVGDFYYELGVQIVEVCLATSHRNGGIIDLDELREKLIASRQRIKGKQQQEDISSDDIKQSIDKLSILGKGFRLIPVGGGRYIVQSVPTELSMDHTCILQRAEGRGYVSASELMNAMGWKECRTLKALDDLVKEGLAWVDDQDRERLYWFPGLVKDRDAVTLPS